MCSQLGFSQLMVEVNHAPRDHETIGSKYSVEHESTMLYCSVVLVVASFFRLISIASFFRLVSIASRDNVTVPLCFFIVTKNVTVPVEQAVTEKRKIL
jgi:hypothetical protein